MAEKILNINLNDENSAKIAEILGNKTCKKILGLIADKENISEGDIARQLKIPANTANYNVKKLVSAGLIETTTSFFWSVKGKKIKTYRLANKKIIISTKNSIKGMLITSLGVGVMGFLIKTLSNLSTINKFSSFESSRSSVKELAYSAAPKMIESQNWIPLSPFYNTLAWFIMGCIVGFILYLIYKKMKGGKS